MKLGQRLPLTLSVINRSAVGLCQTEQTQNIHTESPVQLSSLNNPPHTASPPLLINNLPGAICYHGKRPAQLRLAAVSVAPELGRRTCMAGCWQVLHGAQWVVKNVPAHWSVFKQSSCPERPSWCTSVISNPTLRQHLVFSEEDNSSFKVLMRG